MYNIVLVEDEKDLGSLIIRYLEKEGYKATLFTSGEDAIKHVDNKYDLWILDIMLPGNINGYDLIKEIRQCHPNMPVVFASARDEDIDRIMGLELGSDDYISKPFSIRELLLRIKNILNRCYGSSESNSNIIDYENYKIDLEKRKVFYDNEIINLTSKEFDLFILLLTNKTKAFSREEILYKIWGEQYYGSDRVVDDLLRRLRQKLVHIKVETIYGFGYRLS